MATAADWQALSSSAIARRHRGDIHGAIEDLTKAISLARTIPNFAEQTAVDLQYLAGIYVDCKALGEAEIAMREAIELSRRLDPVLLASNLHGLATIQWLKGEYREALASAEEAHHLYQQQGHSYDIAQTEELSDRIRTELGKRRAAPARAASRRGETCPIQDNFPAYTGSGRIVPCVLAGGLTPTVPFRANLAALDRLRRVPLGLAWQPTASEEQARPCATPDCQLAR
jgi:ATP/maltotriose-dependent transcriptional regulator MalT